MTYIPIIHLDTASGRIEIGQSGPCRFCLKSSPEVTFSKKAHAISNLLGNDEIFSIDECDTCNEFFGISFEDDLSKYLGGMRTLSQMNGKNGIPSYKTKQKLSRIDVGADGVKMISTDGDEIIQIDESTNSVAIKIQKQAYSPLGVYRAFVKMALSIAPVELLSSLNMTRQWLLDITLVGYPYFRPFMIETFIPGPGPLKNNVFVMLLRRSGDENMPALVFWLSVSNYCFQIPVPCPVFDQNLAGKTVLFPRIPHMLDDNNPHGQFKARTVDLSSAEKVKDQVDTIHMHYEKIIINDQHAQQGDASGPAR